MADRPESINRRDESTEPARDETTRVLIVGTDCRLGARLYDLWQTRGGLVDVIGHVAQPVMFPVALSGLVESGNANFPHAVTADRPDFAARCAAAELVYVIGSGPGVELDGSGVGSEDVDLVAAVLRRLDPKRCRSVVVLSTAMVYGAAPGNPIPISEMEAPADDLPLRVAERRDRERLVGEWGRTHGVPVAVLRPSLIGSAAARSWMDRSVFGARRVLPHERAPIQYVHIDDVVSAFDHVATHQLAGIFNVAPTGWLDEALLFALADVRLSIRVGPRVLAAWWSFLSVLQPGRSASDVRQFTVFPWVVANDALVATGWSPSHSNEEAFLVSHRVGWWSAQTARRRQDVALGAAGTALAVGVGVLSRALRRLFRQKSL